MFLIFNSASCRAAKSFNLGIDYFFNRKTRDLNQISIPRKIFSNINSEFIELHDFINAFEKACGTVIYLWFSGDHNANVKLICPTESIWPYDHPSII